MFRGPGGPLRRRLDGHRPTRRKSSVLCLGHLFGVMDAVRWRAFEGHVIDPFDRFGWGRRPDEIILPRTAQDDDGASAGPRDDIEIGANGGGARAQASHAETTRPA